MKYVFIKVYGKIPRELPVIFPNDLSHADVVKALVACCPELEGGVAISAGSMSSMAIDGDDVCPDGSVTLKIKSGRDEDGQKIQMIDYTHGVL